MPEYAEVMHFDMEDGQFISDTHVEQRSNICVLAAGMARQFFPVDKPIGKTVRVRELPCVVISVAKEQAPMTFGISVVVGVAFGIYPSLRAARKNPIKALKHE